MNWQLKKRNIVGKLYKFCAHTFVQCEIFCRLFFGGYIITALKIIISVATTLKRELIFVGILTASLNR
jgi:hypothetical protein